MAKAISIEDTLARLNAIATPLLTGDALTELTVALNSKSNVVVARAARIISEAGLSHLTAQLADAFSRFMIKPVTTDKGCLAKLAIVEALYTFGADAQDVFLAGIHHVQKEPTFGGSVDSAAELRGMCALGLVRMGYGDILTELADLLMDREQQARILAARACGYTESENAAPLLRMRILVGGEDIDTQAEAMNALAKLTPVKSLPLLEKFLDDPNEQTRTIAAAAIGATRRPEAFELIARQWESTVNLDARRPLLLALATLRLPASVDFLLRLLEEERPPVAAAALEALAVYKHDESMTARIRKIIETRDEPDVASAFRDAFR